MAVFTLKRCVCDVSPFPNVEQGVFLAGQAEMMPVLFMEYECHATPHSWLRGLLAFGQLWKKLITGLLNVTTSGRLVIND